MRWIFVNEIEIFCFFLGKWRIKGLNFLVFVFWKLGIGYLWKRWGIEKIERINL